MLLAFMEEAVEFMHLVHRKLHPAICSYDGLNFFSKSRDELWIGREVIQSVVTWSMLGPHPNMCFAYGGKGLSSGTLVIRTQTLTLAHDWWLMIDD